MISVQKPKQKKSSKSHKPSRDVSASTGKGFTNLGSASNEAGGSHSVGAVNITTTPATSIMTSPIIKPTPSHWFTAEIQQMMHGLGDCRKPLAESATLIEEIVHHQMKKLLYQAEEVGRLRNARFLGIEDFLFLLRRDKVKLRRLIRYMSLKDVKTAAYKASHIEEEEGSEQGELKQPAKKRRKICYDFLSTIDQTGEMVALFEEENVDEVKRERALRAELQSRTMDQQQYMDFCEARQASFMPRYRTQKFKDWLMQGVFLDIKPNPLAVEVLSYLAYETVAQVVDLALLVKRDSQGRVDDPFAQTLPPVCINHDSFPPIQSQQTILTGGTTIKSPPGTSRSTSPVNSPPSTPTTPSPAQGLSHSQSSLTSSGGSAKSKSKKKKKVGSSESKNIFTSQAIMPGEIREALRRYTQCIGPFADFTKFPTDTTLRWILCC